MRNKENGATTEAIKLPQVGEWWKDCNGLILFIAYNSATSLGLNCEFPITAIDGKGNITAYTTRGDYYSFEDYSHYDLIEHLPDCTGFDWKPEIFPKYVVSDWVDKTVYIRRDSTTLMSLFDKYNECIKSNVIWDKDHDSFIARGIWRYVTKEEALALTVPPTPNRVPVNLYMDVEYYNSTDRSYLAVHKGEVGEMWKPIKYDPSIGFYLETK